MSTEPATHGSQRLTIAAAPASTRPIPARGSARGTVTRWTGGTNTSAAGGGGGSIRGARTTDRSSSADSSSTGNPRIVESSAATGSDAANPGTVWSATARFPWGGGGSRREGRKPNRWGCRWRWIIGVLRRRGRGEAPHDEGRARAGSAATHLERLWVQSSACRGASARKAVDLTAFPRERRREPPRAARPRRWPWPIGCVRGSRRWTHDGVGDGRGRPRRVRRRAASTPSSARGPWSPSRCCWPSACRR